MASKYTHKGTKMTGTKATATTRPGAGISKSNKGDTYLNTSTGHVYKCTEGGNKDKAKWKYATTVIIKEPNISVTGAKLVREGKGSHVMTLTWGVPKRLVSEKNGKRAQALVVRWILDISTDKRDVVDKDVVQNEKKTSHSENLANFTVEKGKKVTKYTRESFYPFTKIKLLSVTASIVPKNSEGEGSKTKKGKAVKQVAGPYAFAAPKAPKIGSWKFDTETGIVSCVVTTDPGHGKFERYDTEYKVTIIDKQAGTTKTIVSDSKTATSRTFSYDASNYQQLGKDKYIEMRVQARARGFAGDSAWVTDSYYVSFPKPVTIHNDAKDPEKQVSVSSRESSGKVTVPIAVNRNAQFPVDSVKLQMLVNVPYARANLIPGDAEWRDAGAIDNGNCTALIGSVGDMIPDAGNHTWVRVKAWHANEDVLYSYSNTVEVPLFTPAPTAADDKCTILSATSNADGESVTVVVGYDAKDSDTDDDATGTQVGWSEHEDAWTSTEQPETFDIDWAGTKTKSGEAGYDEWNYAHTLVIRGLEEGASYHIRARRYLVDEEDKVTYGEWCNAIVAQTSSTPPSVVLNAPPVVRAGRGLSLSWTLAARTAQTAWQVYMGDVILASGDDATGACVVPAERVAEYAANGTISVGVRCSTGGEWVESGTSTVVVAEPPEALCGASTITAQPASFVVESASADLSVAWAVTATSDAGTGPDGSVDQYSGDVAASDTSRLALTVVAWADSLLHAQYAAQVTDATTALATAQAALDRLQPGDDGYNDALEAVTFAQAALTEAQALESTPQVRRQANVTLPARRILHDEASYDVTVTPTDPATSLSGGTATCEMAIDYAHKAPTPSEDIEVEPYVTTDEKGFVVRGCTIALISPEGAADSDVYEIYRMTHDGEQLASPEGGLPLEGTIDDQWATFGDAGDYGYRIVCRTVDGSIAWDDYDYFADARVLRIDWGSQSVELPYNLAESDKYSKDVDIRTHWDGTVDAYHNQGVRRTASLSTDVIRIEDAETAALLRSLARYPGTAYVRTPTGSAYEAAVQVSGMDVQASALGVSIDATEVAPSADRELPRPPQSESDEIDYDDPPIPEETEG